MKSIFKAASQTGGAAIIAMIFGVITNKILALVLGLEGLGVFSILGQIQSTAIVLATLGGSTALVQGIASREGEERDKYIITTFWLIFIATLLTTVGFVIFSSWIKQLLLSKDSISEYLIQWLALPIALSIVYSYLCAVLNGYRAVGRLAIVKIVGAILTALIVYPITNYIKSGNEFGFILLMSGALLFQTFIALFILYREKWIPSFSYTLGRQELRHFFSMSGAVFVTSQVGTIVILSINALIVSYSGLASAGIFNAAWNLSMLYVMLILTSFNTYYLPEMSRTNSKGDCVKLMINVSRISLFAMIPLITTVIVLKPLIISNLYSPDFIGSTKILTWTLIGDYFKISSYVIATPVVAYARMKVYFWTELAWSVIFLVLSIISVVLFRSIQGVGVAFMVVYMLYFAYYLYYTRKNYNFAISGKMSRVWLLGICLILFASIYSWSFDFVEWYSACVFIGISVILIYNLLEIQEKKNILIFLTLRLGWKVE